VILVVPIHGTWYRSFYARYSEYSKSHGRGGLCARCGFYGETLRDGPLRALRPVLVHSLGI